MGKYDLSAEAAATDAEFQTVMAKLGMLTEEQIIELLPKKTDQAALLAIIAEVNAATDDNSKKAALLANLATATDAVKKDATANQLAAEGPLLPILLANRLQSLAAKHMQAIDLM